MKKLLPILIMSSLLLALVTGCTPNTPRKALPGTDAFSRADSRAHTRADDVGRAHGRAFGLALCRR